MNRKLAAGVASAALIALSGCHKGTNSAPTGQVVASVGGQEITQREVQAELNGYSSPDENATRKAQQGAVQAILNRKILSKAGKDAGIEKSADYQLMRARSSELALAQAYEQQIASKLPRPTEDEIKQFMAQHPNTFAQRKIYVVDRIEIPASTPRKVLDAINPLHNMEDIEKVLLSNGVDYVRAPGSIDARATPPAIIDQIAKMPQSEPFVIPGSTIFSINQVKEARTVPFSGPAAEDFAQRAVMSERANKAIVDKLAELRKSAGDVKYQAGYSPAPAGTQSKKP